MNSDSLIFVSALVLALIALIVALLAYLKVSKVLEKTAPIRIKKYAKEAFNEQMIMEKADATADSADDVTFCYVIKIFFLTRVLGKIFPNKSWYRCRF